VNKSKLKILTNPKLSVRTYDLNMAHLQVLPVVSIMATGRTGSDFLQSLLDNHEEVLTFNGHFLVYSEYFKSSKVLGTESPDVKDLVDEMVGFYIYKLISRYELVEGKDKLGDNYDESFAVDTGTFKLHMLGLLNKVELNTRNILLAFYGAYAINLNHNILNKKVFVHHPHLAFEFNLFYEDFKKCRVIFTSRDPRANFCSQVEHYRKHSKSHDCQQHVYNSLEMILSHSSVVEGKGLDYISTRLEDLPREDYMLAFAKWLGIEFRECLLRSTWAGLDWHGDRLSTKKFSATGWSKDRVENNWENKLSFSDKSIFNYILNKRLIDYCYSSKKTKIWDSFIVFLLIFLPLKFEWRFLSFGYFKYMFLRGSNKNRIQYLLTPVFYFKRVKLCLKYFWKTFLGIRETNKMIGRTNEMG
jgi:hypothetical protein